jgi:hypothetical protein
MYRKKFNIPLLSIFILIMVIVIFILFIQVFSSAKQAKKAVDNFYTYEQQGNFSDSWELFHPYMKEKFPKAAFIQDRSHVFIGHFGTETFTYTIDDAEEFDEWRPQKDHSIFKDGYRMVVTQKYKGKYGSFNFQQEVFVVEHKGDWLLLWDYN